MIIPNIWKNKKCSKPPTSSISSSAKPPRPPRPPRLSVCCSKIQPLNSAPAAAATFPTSHCTAPAPATARPWPGASGGGPPGPSRFAGPRERGSGPPGLRPTRRRWEGPMAAPHRPRLSVGAPGPWWDPSMIQRCWGLAPKRRLI